MEKLAMILGRYVVLCSSRGEGGKETGNGGN